LSIAAFTAEADTSIGPVGRHRSRDIRIDGWVTAAVTGGADATFVRDEAQPRQRAQDHGHTERVSRPPPAWRDERRIRRSQREIPEQLLAADPREPSQTLQLLVREHRGRCNSS
jgi:hypothetical protein